MFTSPSLGQFITRSTFARQVAVLVAGCFSFVASPVFAQGHVTGKYFVDTLYPLLEKSECRMCHNDNGVASTTRLQLPPEGATPAAIEAFGLRLFPLIDPAQPAQSLLLRKPTLRTPHAGGERIRKGSPEEKAVSTWVDFLVKLPEVERKAALGRLESGVKRAAAVQGELRRLTHSQYNNTVRDLLGDFTRPADQFPQEDFLHGFTNQVEGQSIPPLLAESYTLAGEKLAATAFRRGDTNKLIPCKPTSARDAACRDRFIRSFGAKAFRRPLLDKEVAGYAKLFREGSIVGKDFVSGAKLVVEAMLQSPNFLFHLEDGPQGKSRQYGTASRLSYFLWDTMPDARLFQLAAKGQLGTPEQIKAATETLLESPLAKRSLDRYLAQWMRFDRVLGSSRSSQIYPDFGGSLLTAMTEETRHLFNDLVWNDGNFMEMFNARHTFISSRLAQLYGFEPPVEDFARVKYPATANRAGVLGHAGFLTLTGNPADTSPTSRGLFVREQFLCQEVPPPPPGVDTNLPSSTDKPMTNRERLGVHLTNKSCSSCHTLVDPIGFGLEGFDNIGRQRAQLTIRSQEKRDPVTRKVVPAKEVKLDLDTTGYVQGVADSGFSNAAELGNILAQDPTCQRCVVKQIFRYATGRHEAEADRPELDRLYGVFKDSQFRFRQLLFALVASPVFLTEPEATRAAITAKR
jgi:hypothetical protein